MTKDLLSVADLSAGEITDLLDQAMTLKAVRRDGDAPRPFAGRTLANIFDKPSLRTRITFELAALELGGYAIRLATSEIGLGERETIGDTARNLERWVDAVAARISSHDDLAVLARAMRTPVINAMTDAEHPCQALAFALTVREHRGELRDLHTVFVGAGNNVSHSLMLLSPLAGMDFTLCCHPSYGPSPEVADRASALASAHRTRFAVVHDPQAAAASADVIYADVWVSMGEEAQAQARLAAFRPYQVNEALLEHARSGCLVSHCLPAKRGLEITDAVLDGTASVAFDEAENRLHIQKAVLAALVA